jgi:hypothetical protein
LAKRTCFQVDKQGAKYLASAGARQPVKETLDHHSILPPFRAEQKSRVPRAAHLVDDF